MYKCVICHKDDSTQLVQLREKGSQGINKASKQRGDTLEIAPGEMSMRNADEYTPTLMSSKEREKKNLDKNRSDMPTLRSKSQFQFEHCLF